MRKKDTTKRKKVKKTYILSPNLENIKRLKKDEIAARKRLHPELLGHNMIFTEAHAKLLSARLLLLREENRFNIQITDTIFQNAIESYYGKELSDTKNLQGEPKKSCQKQVNDFFSRFRNSENKSKLKEKVVTCSLSTLKNHEKYDPKIEKIIDKDSADKETIIQQIGYVNGRTSVNDLCLLADFYGVSPSYLLGEIDEKTIETHKLNEGLGLSEEAIKFIKDLSEKDKETLNYLLESFEGTKLLSTITEYLVLPEKIKYDKIKDIILRLKANYICQRQEDFGDCATIDYEHNITNKTLTKNNDILYSKIIRLITEIFNGEKKSQKVEENYTKRFYSHIIKRWNLMPKTRDSLRKSTQ